MAQRLALKTKIRESSGERIVFSSDFREFVRRMDEFGYGPRAEIRVEQEDGFVFFWIPVPGNQRLPTGKTIKIRKPTKKQIAVAEQIAEHKKKRALGIKIPGHVPGVGVKKKRRVRIVKKVK